MSTKISNHSASLGYLAAQGCQALRGVSASPRLDAEVLLAHTAGISRSVVFAFSERTIRPEMLEGPLIVQEYSGTTWVPAGWTVKPDLWGCLHLTRGLG